jgi:hypothetical protein
MTNSRPNLDKDLPVSAFKQTYYLKRELEEFCRQHNIPISGGKDDITQAITFFLEQGKVETVLRKKETTHVLPTPEIISLDSKIEDDFRCTERHRKFFSSVIKGKFHFSTAFQKYLKTHAGYRYEDAVTAWYALQEQKKNIQEKEIGSQFKYNTYIRDFFKHNPGRSLKEAILCWNYKKSVPGNHIYHPDDLKMLK